MRVLFIFCVLLVTQTFASPLLLKNATLLDPADESTRRGHLLLRDGKIEEILESIPADYAGDVLDLKWKWVLPGFRDLHVHAYGNLSPSGSYHQLGLEGSARSMLYAGVTGFLDLFHQENAILELRDKQRAGKLGETGPFADIFAAGPIFTSTGGHGTEYGQFTRVINSPLQAELEIRALALKKPDVIKIVYDHAVPHFTTLTKPTLKRALEVAKELGIKTVVHIGTWEDAEQAIDFGTNAITHTFSSDISPALVEKFRSRNVTYIPTLAVQMDFLNITQKAALLDAPLLKEIVPNAFLASYKDEKTYLPLAKGWLEYQKKGYASFQKNFLALVEGGVPLVAGTDAANMGTFQGYSLHRELELMVQAGVSAQVALRSATSQACSFIGLDCRIRKGAAADLVVLEDSPLKEISNTQRISNVIYHGRVVDRIRLKELISKVPVQGASQNFGGVAIPCAHVHSRRK